MGKREGTGFGRAVPAADWTSRTDVEEIRIYRPASFQGGAGVGLSICVSQHF